MTPAAGDPGTAPAGPPALTCLFLLWGDKYPEEEVNRLARSIARHLRRPARFLCLTDRPRPDLLPFVETMPIPEPFLAPAFLRGGAQAKLSMFTAGIADPAIPAVFFDLDTLVRGDVMRLAALATPGTLHMIPATWGPAWPLLRLWARLTGKRKIRGNGSIYVFRPGDWTHVPGDFLRRWRETGPERDYSLVADDRFLSVIAGDGLRPIPTTLSVKAPNEFGAHLRLWSALKGRLPAVARRRRNLVAISFPGEAFKPETLAAAPEGAVLTDRRARHIVWTDAATSGLRREIAAHWSGG